MISTGGRPTATVAVLAFGGVLFSITQTMAIPLTPVMPALVATSIETSSWLVTGPLLVGAALTPLLARLADQRGKKAVLIAVFSAMALGAFVTGATSSIAIMIAGRCLQGLGAAFVPIAISLLRDLLPARRIAGGIGLLSATLGIGAALGVPIAAAVAGWTDWHVVFFATGVLDLLQIGLLLALVRDGPTVAGGRFDLLGAGLLTVALAGFLVGITQGSTWGWTSPGVIGALLLSVVLFLVWMRRSLRITDPVVDVRLATRPPIMLANALAFVVGFAFFGNQLVTTQLVQAPRATGYGFGFDLFEAALLQIPAGLAVIVFSLVSSALSSRYGARVTMIVAMPLLIGGYVLHLTQPSIHGAVLALTVVSIGTALAYSALPLLLVGVPLTAMASANGVNVLIRTVGQAACSAVVATALAGFTMRVAGETWPTEEAFRIAYSAPLAACLVATVIAVAVALRPGGEYPVGGSRTSDAI